MKSCSLTPPSNFDDLSPNVLRTQVQIFVASAYKILSGNNSIERCLLLAHMLFLCPSVILTQPICIQYFIIYVMPVISLFIKSKGNWNDIYDFSPRVSLISMTVNDWVSIRAIYTAVGACNTVTHLFGDSMYYSDFFS
jgi:hypothetical protein